MAKQPSQRAGAVRREQETQGSGCGVGRLQYAVGRRMLHMLSLVCNNLLGSIVQEGHC
jgi:hypothetical protein